jgi:hypothetical protein
MRVFLYCLATLIFSAPQAFACVIQDGKLVCPPPPKFSPTGTDLLQGNPDLLKLGNNLTGQFKDYRIDPNSLKMELIVPKLSGE